MKRIRWLILLCAGFVPLGAQTANNEGSADAIRSLEQQWTTGQAHNNNAALNLIFANSLVYVEYGKLVTKGEYLAQVKRAAPKSDQIEMEPMSVHLFGQTAVAVGVYAEKQVQGSHRDLHRWRFVDTWVYEKSGWMLVAAGSSLIKN